MAFSRFATDDRGHSSAVASVLFTRGTDKQPETTKSGSYIYDCSASNYHEWEFRTRLRMKASGDDEPSKYAEAMSKVVDGLRGEAFVVAKELGLERIWQPGDEFTDAGLDVLVKANSILISVEATDVVHHHELLSELLGQVVTGGER